MLNRIMVIGIFAVIISNMLICCEYSHAKFSIPTNPYPSNTLVYKLKGFVKNIIANKEVGNYKARIKNIVNKDIEIGNKRINEGLDAYYDDKDQLHWILLYCTELADDANTRGFYEEIEKAITKGVEMK